MPPKRQVLELFPKRNEQLHTRSELNRAAFRAVSLAANPAAPFAPAQLAAPAAATANRSKDFNGAFILL